ncbi:bifunctional UDP-N-acetylmuramoyl-tripeptide:D-alanyl-D-alanine ligase/alanine racemase [Microvirga sp. STS02]|uniref:bifunctional UDP-N-acetylmuramoyl-tripeptide:D-alanyl-D-alanine ligase/alanine racemase n=1 Tax=Hymenobacter negativus TaxID=2795026 RepID=UPI0018DCEA39|nr:MULTISPECIES: bifunctional UDP-N-acetylmuramoyl-tripeptide:D-alanyl-D-alanine ligase/alanine racemase [Bacteria]MBH8571413.1 bifunctional UDP-N-acetylmuramoyl-tripeptide:D-alanyl-D-alanine ligase/alanine racemase [Hymenobacter negativus]MBR7211153.1 bifunctional UDP-N-acetylmuramoyl-tripeptide:D-alanyl-D-alanine ligase/alanine racemase [Microvirga sp. STS02]
MLFPRFLDLPALVPGRLLQAPADATAEVRHLLLDSRRVGLPAGAVFFALRGPSHDGHRYLPDLYTQGVRLFVVEESAALPGGLATYAGAGILAVGSPLAALQSLAAAHRAGFAGPVIGITGSNGKTIVKEWLAQLLSPDEDICRSPRSYNSQVGVPLSVWELNPERHTLGIFEAGISEVGEMAHLAKIIQPTEGIFTNLGTAHDAGFASEEQKLHEKLQLFQGQRFQCLFYCADQPQVRAAVAALHLPGFCWTRLPQQPADLRFTTEASPAHATRLHADYLATGLSAAFTLPFADEPSIENALHCLAVLLHRQVEPAEIQRRLLRLHPVAMRLEMKLGRHDSYLLDDTYNNDLAGLALALNALARQSRPGRRTLILSDVLESGLSSTELYARVAALLPAAGVSRLVGIGEEISQLKVKSEELSVGAAEADSNDPSNQLLTPNSQLLTQFYPTTEAFLAQLNPTDFAHETILIKGARRFGFERIVAALQAQQHGTLLEVNLDALSHNLQHYRRQLRPGTKLMVMVKAFAYGAGSYEVASLLEFQRADYLAVAYADEGVALREAGISLPIMVMNAAPDAFEALRRYRLEPEIYSFEMLDEYLATFSEPADNSLPAPKIHLKLDTGMRRLGFDEADLPALAARLRQHAARLPVASMMTHLAAADDPGHDDFTHEQLAAFRRMTATLEAALGHSVLKHALNSAGILRFPEAQFDMVRLGIGLYGVDASNTADPTALRPVSQLRTTISQIKTLPAGFTVGYGRRGTAAATERRIATLAIGYADGYDRRFGNGTGTVLIHGQPAPLIGSVCMDMCMVDVTAIPAARAGDVALIFGEGLPLPELASRIGTIAYELLTNVSERVKRVFVSE